MGGDVQGRQARSGAVELVKIDEVRGPTNIPDHDTAISPRGCQDGLVPRRPGHLGTGEVTGQMKHAFTLGERERERDLFLGDGRAMMAITSIKSNKKDVFRITYAGFTLDTPTARILRSYVLTKINYRINAVLMPTEREGRGARAKITQLHMHSQCSDAKK